jgi:tight adherence protein C
MLVLALLALALCGLAIAALVRSVTLSRMRVATHLEDLEAYGYAAAAPTLAPDSAELRIGALGRLSGRLGDMVAARIGAVREAELRKLLVGAGMYSTSPRTVLGYRVLAAASLPALGLLAAHGAFGRVVLGGLLAVCGWTLPLTYVRRRAARRAAEMERQIPDLIDQLVVSLEAGVGFSAALQTAVNRLGGALGQEMRLTLQEQRIGASLTDSLQHVRERVDSPNLQSFVRAVVQGERLGVSIGNVMRDLATDMRKRRRQMAEEQAQKTPVKLLLPLVFLILPTIFIVVLVPPMLDFINNI